MFTCLISALLPTGTYNFLAEQVPDATTLLHFRHLLDENRIGEMIFADVKTRLEKAGLMMHGGTIVNATIIASPSSTKNRESRRAPEMHQTKKDNQWYHGMKVHSGVDAGSGYVHTFTGTAANIHDIDETAKLIREDDGVVYGDYGYNRGDKRDESRNDGHLSRFVLVSNKEKEPFECLLKYRKRETNESFFEAEKQHADGTRDILDDDLKLKPWQ